MKIWVTADLHLGHANIIPLARRPFRHLKEMDAVLISNWNVVVAPGDLVWVLGDLILKTTVSSWLRYRRQLNGRIMLVPGNHDDPHITRSRYLPESNVGIAPALHREGPAVLCHYPLASWDGQHRGTVHLHGHSHGSLAPMQGRLDVGADVHDFRPIRFQEAIELARTGGAPTRSLPNPMLENVL